MKNKNMNLKIKIKGYYIPSLVVMVGFFLVLQPAQAQINLLQNPDFESFTGTPNDGVSDNFANWNERELTYGNIIEASTDKQSGNYAVKLTSKSKNNPAAIDSYISLSPSTSYYLEWYGKVASPKGSLQLRVFYYDQQAQESHYLENSDTNDYMSWNDRGNSLDGVRIDNNDNFYDDDNVWVKRSFVFTTASTPQTYYIYFSATGRYEDTTVAYLDKVSLSKAVLNWDIANDNWPQGSDKIVLNPIQGFENYSAEVSVSRDSVNKYSETIENISASPRTIDPNLEDGIYNVSIKLREKSSGSLDQEFIFRVAGKHLRRLNELLYISAWTKLYRDIGLNDVVKSLNESPYTGFISRVTDIYDTAPPPTLAEFSSAVDLIKNNVNPSHKAVWPQVFFNRFCGCDPINGCSPWLDAAYAGRIKGLDLWNDSGSHALQDFYDLFNVSLRVAKETGTPGIAVDHELYSNYKNSSLAYLVQEIGKPEAEVVSQLDAVGAQMADYVNQIYPDAVLLFYSYKATGSHESNESYNMSTSYIIEGMLKRAKDQKYSFKVVDGGESLMGYIHPSYDHLKQDLIKQEKSQMSEIYSYPNFDLGGTLAPYNDLSKGTFLTICGPWGTCDWQAGDGLQTIDDLVPLMKTLFETRKYVWFYGAGTAPYNEYNPEDYIPIRQRIKAILDSLSVLLKGDLNTDNLVNQLDFDILKSDFLKLTANLSNPKSDIDGDGEVSIKDVGIMMSGWKP